TIPRMAGVSSRTRSRPTLVSPRPRTVARWSSGWPLRPRTSFTRSAMSGSLLGTDLLQLLAAQARHLFRTAQPPQTIECRLHDVRDPVDVHHPVVQLGQVVRIDRYRHSLSLELQTGFAGAVGDRRDAAVIVEPVAVEHDRADLRRLALLRDELSHFLRQVAL